MNITTKRRSIKNAAKKVNSGEKCSAEVIGKSRMIPMKSEACGVVEKGSDTRRNRDKKADPRENAEKFVKMTLAKGILGLRNEFAKNKRVYDMDKALVFQRNQNKNRYKDVACLDSTRVIVKGVEPEGYIHASFVDTPRKSRRFICAQAPMDNTCRDFWMMCLQERVKIIIMLCNFIEKGAKKCSEYYPETVGATKAFGNITVTKTSEDLFHFASETQIKIRVSALTVNENGAEVQKCLHYQWVDWPDRGVPGADLAPVELLDKVYKTRTPIVVHCSAGIGRTGSIVLLQILLELLADGKQFDGVERLMLKMREGRANSVQTDHQYMYVHQVLLTYLRALQLLDASAVPLVDKFGADYTKAVANML